MNTVDASRATQVRRIDPSVAVPAEASTDERARALTLDWVPPVALSALLLVATWYNGAFALRHWAPVALLALAILAAAAASGALWVPERAARIALLALWGFAAWTLLSAIWADSPSRALEGAGRTALYASLFTVPCAMTWNGRNAARVGGLLVASLATIAGVTLVELLADPESLFLAGRLDDPVGYRNATACLFAVAFWPLVSAAAHRQLSPVLRAPAFSAGALVLGLAFLTQARGVALGLLLGGAVAIGLGPDRLRRAWVAAILAGGLALASERLLMPFRAFSDNGDATAADISPAVDALVVLVLAALVVGLLGALFDGGLRLGGPARAAIGRTMAAGLVVVTLAAAVGAVVAVGNPFTFVSDRYDEFKSLETTAPGDSRLTFGGGQRADLWRVSLDEFSEHPVTGVGEGSYQFGYYEERRTDRNLSTPHSLVFSVVAELGAVGMLLLLLFLGALCAAVAARWRGADASARWWASALLAAATVGLCQSTVDWIWLVPGVVGACFLLAGLGVAALRPERPEPGRRLALAPRVALGGALALLAALVVSFYLGDVSIRKARTTSSNEPAERLDAAETAEKLLPWSTAPLYLKAGAHEDLGERAAARRDLREALDAEPDNFVTYALLGDLEVRAGRDRRARAMYRRALALNPRDVGLRKLSRGEFGS
jgi:O-antigen ligase